MAITTHSTERRFTPDRRSANVNNATAAHPDRLSTINPNAVHSNAVQPNTSRANPIRASANTLSVLEWVAMGLLIVGGINWGLVGFFGFDLVAAIFGPMSVLSRIVYALVGLSAIYTIFSCVKLSRRS
ncbi:MAG: DUF378 domain-containing protein [Cellvibrionaceae bacterium]|nr:DUF378 domain-containing protein [Cellvibrionaceae bacterium]